MGAGIPNMDGMALNPADNIEAPAVLPADNKDAPADCTGVVMAVAGAVSLTRVISGTSTDAVARTAGACGCGGGCSVGGGGGCGNPPGKEGGNPLDTGGSLGPVGRLLYLRLGFISPKVIFTVWRWLCFCFCFCRFTIY